MRGGVHPREVVFDERPCAAEGRWRSQVEVDARGRGRVRRARLLARAAVPHGNRGGHEAIVLAQRAERMDERGPRLPTELEDRVSSRNREEPWKLAGADECLRQLRVWPRIGVWRGWSTGDLSPECVDHAPLFGDLLGIPGDQRLLR